MLTGKQKNAPVPQNYFNSQSRGAALCCQMSTELKVGDPAPDFTAMALGGAYGSDGVRVQKSDFAGSYVVLYFYPKDDTPGCTIQACGLRDRWPDFQGKDAAVFGVSVDPLTNHREFIAKYGLPFPLLSDEEKRMVQDYGVWGERSWGGKLFMGAERSTFIIGPDGKIAAIFHRVKPEEHAQQVLNVLEEKRAA